MNKQRGFLTLAVILIILGVAVVAGGGVYLWQTYNPTPVAPITPEIITTTPSITVTSPNGGENFVSGSSQKIYVTWTTTNVLPQDGINLIILDNTGKNVVETGILGTQSTLGVNGSYNWTPMLPVGQYKIKAQACTIVGPIEARCGTVLAEDTSNNYFTITATTPDTTSTPSITVLPIKVTSPVAGTVYRTGDTINISWLTTNITTDNLGLSIVDINGTVVTGPSGMGVGIISFDTPNTGNFSWQIPSNLRLGSNYRISIHSKTSGPPMKGYSSYFSIVAP